MISLVYLFNGIKSYVGSYDEVMLIIASDNVKVLELKRV